MPSEKIQLQLNCLPLNNCKEELKVCNNAYNRILNKFNISDLVSGDVNTLKKKAGYLFMIRNKENNRIVSSEQFNIASKESFLSVEKVLNKVTGNLPYWRNDFVENTYSETSALWVDHDYNGLGLSDLIVRMCVMAAIKCKVKYLIAFYNKYSRKNALRFGFETRNDIGNNGKIYYPDKRYESTISMLNTTNLRKVHSKELMLIREMMQKKHSNCVMKIKDRKIILNYDLRNLFSDVVAQTK